MALFGNNEEEQAPPPSGPPTDLVLKMRSQGYSNNQIVQSLQREGYKSHDIFDAMNQADIKGNVAPVNSENPSMAQPENEMTMTQPPMQESEMMSQPPMPTMNQAQQFEQPTSISNDKEQMEEVVETIIAEKWEELVKDVKKIVDWKESTEKKMTQIDLQIKNITENFDKLHKGVLGKISEYDEGLTNVGTEIKALEKVFQKILPTFTENVNELSRITSSMNKKK